MSDAAVSSAPESRSSTPRPAPILQATALRKTYRMGRVDVPVLKGASLTVRDGEWVAILGASGSGKSTLLHLLGDLDRPDAGSEEVRFRGQDIRRMSLRQRNHYRNRSVGFVFQFYHLLPELTVLENAMLPALLRATGRAWIAGAAVSAGSFLLGAALAALVWVVLPLEFAFVSPQMGAMGAMGGVLGVIAGMLIWPAVAVHTGRRREERAREILAAFGLDHRLKHRPRELSGGERQRVAIARALMNGPDVLLADEPTGNLDERTGAEILDLIAAQHAEGLTIVMVTHDPLIAERADRMVHLEDGRVVGR